MRRYQPLIALDADSHRLIDAMDQGDGEPIGAYINDDPSAGPVIIAEEALLAQCNGQATRIRYGDIASVQLPPKDSALGVLTVVTSDGNTCQIHIDGASGRFRDVYEFGRFLMRVRDDVKREEPGSGQ